MKALVTGAFGFLGRRLTKILVERGYEITAVYNKTVDDVSFKTVQCDLTDYEQVKKLFGNVYDVVFHLAGQPAVWYANKHPYEDFQMNVLTTMNLLEAAKDKDITFVYSSSCAVYKDEVSDEKSEVVLENFYAKSKFFCEEMVREYSKRFAVKGSIARISFIYGPGMERNVIFDVMEGLNKGKIDLFISADSTIDFIHVDDVASGLIAVTKKEGLYNISSGEGTVVQELIEKITKGKVQVNYGDRVQKMILRNELARKELSWSPKISLQEGLNTL